MNEWPTARRYLTPDQRLLEVIVRMRDMEWTPEPEQPEEYRQGWQDACERIIEIWSGSQEVGQSTGQGRCDQCGNLGGRHHSNCVLTNG